MNEEIKAKWVAALRSGKYQQTSGQLRRNEGESSSFCCLGVLCDVVNPDAWKHESHEDGTFLSVSGRIARLAGLSHAASSVLTDWNDSKRKSFEEIAAFIEQDLISQVSTCPDCGQQMAKEKDIWVCDFGHPRIERMRDDEDELMK